jgi:anhydro-N-acetylmuramic acid kinase
LESPQGAQLPDVRRAIGLMSGTSLDGVDVALLATDGWRIAEFGPARTYPYTDADRAVLRRSFSDALGICDRDARPGILAEAETLVTMRHAEAVEAFLAEAQLGSADIDLVGFHGQTVFHDPARALTVQIGDGQALADRLSLPVIWDMRAADMAAGGQGAPLAPAFHRALAETAGLTGPVLFLNLGGVANVTWIGADGELIAFDTGPGNGLMDDWVMARCGLAFDDEGQLAASGTPDHRMLDRLLEHPFFSTPPPKSLDRLTFSTASLEGLSDADGAATLLHFTARSAARALELLPKSPRACYASGGGRRNSALMGLLGEILDPIPVAPVESLGLDGDATEAQAFAFLAVRALDGEPLSYPLTTGVREPLTGGRLSRPDASR